MTVSEVGRMAMGSANSESPDFVTHATSGAKSAKLKETNIDKASNFQKNCQITIFYCKTLTKLTK